MRTKLCSPSKHIWKPLNKRSKILKCEVCKTLFPCRDLECGHIDCYLERGCKGTLPSWVTVKDKDEISIAGIDVVLEDK